MCERVHWQMAFESEADRAQFTAILVAVASRRGVPSLSAGARSVTAPLSSSPASSSPAAGHASATGSLASGQQPHMHTNPLHNHSNPTVNSVYQDRIGLGQDRPSVVQISTAGAPEPATASVPNPASRATRIRAIGGATSGGPGTTTVASTSTSGTSATVTSTADSSELSDVRVEAALLDVVQVPTVIPDCVTSALSGTALDVVVEITKVSL